jgi:integral membrane protein
MPAKYFFDQPQFVPPVGMAHGVAFVGYMLAMAVLLRNQGLTQQDWTRTAFAAFYPLGTFFNDGMLRRKQMAASGQPG